MIRADLAPARMAFVRASHRGKEDSVADTRRVLDVFRDRPLGDFSHVFESVLSQGAHQVRARAAAWLAPLDEPSRDLAMKLTFNYPAGAPEIVRAVPALLPRAPAVPRGARFCAPPRPRSADADR